jgi:N-methylhydantoinase A/oxoprolinase/acetone carboxylase beta subunit
MTIALGIDTGGTYTDAALVDQTTGKVLAGMKSLTTRRDLSIGIGRAVTAVLEASLQRKTPVMPRDVGLVGLSTTLATNAIVEGQGSPVCLLLIGYDRALMEKFGFERHLAMRRPFGKRSWPGAIESMPLPFRGISACATPSTSCACGRWSKS